ncbi:hypothetical protein chiPu_0018515 [Chiloscyllium punctatum]|uniref:Uncharacterized protein n=1 Tax=Chiloscyllium punctatum TaxID=137246 RepID=A0A401RNK6_CHIPU|nr:hypothetical protein [Chiloscyllium punctatum]
MGQKCRQFFKVAVLPILTVLHVSLQYVGVQFIAVVKPILKEKWTANVEEAWEGLFDYLTWTMKRGYHDAEQSNNINQSSHTKRRAQSGLKANQNAV